MRTRVDTTPERASHYRQLHDIRLAEVQAMAVSDLQQLRMDMANALSLPKIGEHFRKHGIDFMGLGVTSPDELNTLFLNHIQRQGLRIFMYISTQATQYRHWAMVSMDNGVMVLYNESKRTHWSIYRDQDIQGYLEQRLFGTTRWLVDRSVQLD